ncbi:hypothetical protein ACFL6U_01645 [Planctomycetota bacterium]
MIDKVVDTIFTGPVEFIALAFDRKVLLGVLAILLLVILFVFLHPYDVDYPKGAMTPEHQGNLNFLLEATQDRMPDLPDGLGGLSGSYLPIVDENDFPQLTKKLRQLFESSQNQFIVLGGMDVFNVDQPILKATKGLPQIKQSWIFLRIVSPSKISSTTEAILKEKNIKVELL